MELHYYVDTDSLYIELSDRPGVETREIADGLDADLDAEGGVVGLDIDGASAKARPHDAGDHRVSGEDHPRSLTT